MELYLYIDKQVQIMATYMTFLIPYEAIEYFRQVETITISLSQTRAQTNHYQTFIYTFIDANDENRAQM